MNPETKNELFWFEPSYKNKSQLKMWHPQKRTLVRRIYPYGIPFSYKEDEIYIEDAKTKRFYGVCSRDFIIPAERNLND